MALGAICTKVSDYLFQFSLEVEQRDGVAFALVWQDLLLSLIVDEIELRVSCLAFTGHYRWQDFRSQKHVSFSYIDCWFNGNLWVGQNTHTGAREISRALLAKAGYQNFARARACVYFASPTNRHGHNRPFYSFLPGDLVFAWQWKVIKCNELLGIFSRKQVTLQVAAERRMNLSYLCMFCGFWKSC